MQIQKLNECMDLLKDELGKSMVFADVWSVEEGMSVVSVNSNGGNAARGNKYLAIINKMLADTGAPPLGKYMLTDLAGGMKMVIVPMNEYCAAMVIGKDVQLGYFLHILLPGFIDKFEEAVVA